MKTLNPQTLSNELLTVLEAEDERFKRTAEQEAQKRGSRLFDGVLLDADEAKAAFRKRSRRQAAIMLELLLLIVAFSAMLYPFYRVVRALCR